MTNSAETKRLNAHRKRKANWKNWGPYLSERAWGTVREDYSAHGSAWDYFPHDHARSRAYRWNEDGLMGICDRNQHICFALALWNGRDPILKERLFGLTGPEGNHGEDVKEVYYYLDSTPTHSYMRMLYKYPQRAFPYKQLIDENGRRGYNEPEYELIDTGIFDNDDYFDVFIDYAKGGENDMLVRITVENRGDEAADIHLLPTLWFRNTWAWGYGAGPMGESPTKPTMQLEGGVVKATHSRIGRYVLHADSPDEWIFTNNDNNNRLLFNIPNQSDYVKDAFHRYVVQDDKTAVNPEQVGTKAAAVFKRSVPANGSVTIRLRLSLEQPPEPDNGSGTLQPKRPEIAEASKKALSQPFKDFGRIFSQRKKEADAFYANIQPDHLSDEHRSIQRQAFAGMLWSKQLYYYDVQQWLNGDPGGTPPDARENGRNSDWKHLINFDIISMPDKWEYPWYATWDSAFHCLPLALIDPDFAKRQLILFTREWYMHPNGQLPAYEWAFGDVNPPVHAWAAWRVYKIDAKRNGKRDREFLKGIFQKLMLNFTWWVNRKDKDENNVFQGGFLGLDNISVFDRSAELPTGGHIDQSDGTAWMGAYCLQLMKMALELAREDPVYQDMASKLFEHFLRIAHAMTDIGGDHIGLWDEDDGFFYDVLHLPDGHTEKLKVRSLVGLLPLFAIETIDQKWLDRMPVFERRMDWFLANRPKFSNNFICGDHGHDDSDRNIAALLTPERLHLVLAVMLDENEFLSDYGIRSLSKYHEDNPYTLTAGGEVHSVAYWPAESRSGLFGGNSNWRGPIWFPINYLIIEALQRFHHFYGDDFTVELPTGSGNWVTLDAVATDLSKRLMRIFERDKTGNRPVYGGAQKFQDDPHWRDYVHFYEYFHGDNGAGIGASHQTGWTGLVAKLIQQSG